MKVGGVEKYFRRPSIVCIMSRLCRDFVWIMSGFLGGEITTVGNSYFISMYYEILRREGPEGRVERARSASGRPGDDA